MQLPGREASRMQQERRSGFCNHCGDSRIGFSSWNEAVRSEGEGQKEEVLSLAMRNRVFQKNFMRIGVAGIRAFMEGRNKELSGVAEKVLKSIKRGR